MMIIMYDITRIEYVVNMFIVRCVSMYFLALSHYGMNRFIILYDTKKNKHNDNMIVHM